MIHISGSTENDGSLSSDNSLSSDLMGAGSCSLADSCLAGLNGKTQFQLAEVNAGRKEDLFVDHYEILNKIGRGGMGTVYQVLDRLSREVLAMKLMASDITVDRQHVERFRREMRIAGGLPDHDNIVRVFAVGKERAKYLYYTMEYCEGWDLSRLTKHTRNFSSELLEVGFPIQFALDAATGLHFAHQHGVIHRDVKPSNLIFSASERTVKLLDFGLAKSEVGGSGTHEPTVSMLTKQGQVLGTFSYMSPEQTTNAGFVNPRTDVYSLGATLFFLLTGEPPVKVGGTWSEISRRINTMPTPDVRKIRPDVPSKVGDLIKEMMHKDAGCRPTMQSVICRLRSIKSRLALLAI